MILTPEEQAKYDELQKKLDDDKKKIDDEKIKNLSDAEKDKILKDALDQKRSANDEAKTLREKLEAIDKADKEADMSKDELLKTKDVEIAKLLADNKSAGLKAQASAELIGLGFPSNVVNLGTEGLTDDNYKERVKSFQKEFESIKQAAAQLNVPGRTQKPGDDKTPDILKQQTTGKAAVMDLRNNEAINTAREIAEKEKLLGG